MIMCGDKDVNKCSLECDIIDSSLSNLSSDGIPTTIIPRGRPLSGSVVGAVQLMITHSRQIKQSSDPTSLSNNELNGRLENLKFTENNQHILRDINWRTHGILKSKDKLFTTDTSSKAFSNRPRTRVRAVPLAESAPELSRILGDHHKETELYFRGPNESGHAAMSANSITVHRGEPSNHTLTYDDILILFRLFQGTTRGNIQYAGSLMKLLDVPVWSNTIGKLIKLYEKLEKASVGSFAEKLSQYADEHGCISSGNLTEFFKTIFNAYGVSVNAGDIAMIVKKFNKPLNYVDEISKFCRDEGNRLLWLSASRKLRTICQNALLKEFDVEQELADIDTDGDHLITVNQFREFMKVKLTTSYGKLTLTEMSAIIRHFSRYRLPEANTKTLANNTFKPCDPASSTANSQSKTAAVPMIPEQRVSLREIAGFLGLRYLGNIPAHIRNLIYEKCAKLSVTAVLNEPSHKLAFLINEYCPQSLSRIHSSSTSIGCISLDDIKSMFTTIGVYMNFTHDQVLNSLLRSKAIQIGRMLSMNSLFAYLHLPAPSVTLLTEVYNVSCSHNNNPSAVTSTSMTIGLSADNLISQLLEYLKGNLLHQDKDRLLRSYDLKGEGYLFPSEFFDVCRKLNVMIPNNIYPFHTKAIDALIAKFEVNEKVGCISLQASTT